MDAPRPRIAGVERPDVETVAVGSLEEASTAIARLLSVTQAAYERRAQLEHALESRVAIEQAKGILAERLGMETDEAFAILRRAARTSRTKLRDVARAVQPRAELPAEVRAVLDASSSAAAREV
jgi:hypothetical protein